MEFRYRSRLEIESKQFGQFLDAKWAGSHCDELKYAMSCFCPLSSCRETLQKFNGPRTSSISISGRLVTHMRRFGISDSTSFFMKFRTSTRGDRTADDSGHSSKASTMR